MRVWVLILLFVGLAVSPAMANAQACSPPSAGDWLVNETISCSGEDIVLNGNLLIRGLGNLILEDSTLLFNSTSEGQHGIVVNSSLHVLGSAIEGAKAYTFVSNPGAVLEIRDSFIHDCGYTEGITDLKKGGLYIGSDGAKITNTTFSRNFIALRIYSDNNEIKNSKIISNEASLQGNGSGNVITGNIIRHNPMVGYGLKGTDWRFEHNVVENSSCMFFVSDNSLINNNSFVGNNVCGLTVSGKNNNVTDNDMLSNNVSFPETQGIGLAVTGAENTRVIGNTGLDNGIGLEIHGSENTLVKDSLFNGSDEYDIYILSSVNTTFDNADYTTLVKKWPLEVTVLDTDDDPVEDAEVVIKDNSTKTAFSGITDSNGKIKTNLAEALENGSGTFGFNPYSVNVTRSGYYGNFTKLNLTGDLSLEMTITPIPAPEGNFSIAVVSPTNKTYLKADLTVNGTIKLEVTSFKNMTSCDYDVDDTSGSLSEVNPKRFRAYLNVSGMEGPYEIEFECTSFDDFTNYSRVSFTVYPSRGCVAHDDCANTQRCVNYGCVDLDCVCGYAQNHECVDYECCDDDDCEDEKDYCDTDTHTCKPVICDCPEKITDHECRMEPLYCCKDLQCDENEACINHECVERTLSFSVPEDVVLGQNVSILVMDQNGDVVSKVGIDVKYLDKYPVVIETYYTDNNGIAEIPVKHWGRVDFVARKEGYFTNSNTVSVPEPLNLIFLAEVMILIVCVAGISILGLRFLKGGLPGLPGGGPLRLEKTVSGNRVMLRIRNTKGEKLRDIIIRDSVPRGAFVRCGINPRIEPLDSKTDTLTWQILELDPKEEVTIEYDTRQAGKGFTVSFGGKEYRG